MCNVCNCDTHENTRLIVERVLWNGKVSLHGRTLVTGERGSVVVYSTLEVSVRRLT